MKLEELKVKIAINSEIITSGLWKLTDSPHMHDNCIKDFDELKSEYLELLRELLVPNKTYVMDCYHSILPYDEENDICSFLRKHMVYGKYDTTWDWFLFDIDTPSAINNYCSAGVGTMEENKAEIIECLYVSQWTFLVDDNGNTVINGRPDNDYWDDGKINVVSNNNIFKTHLIANIILASL